MYVRDHRDHGPPFVGGRRLPAIPPTSERTQTYRPKAGALASCMDGEIKNGVVHQLVRLLMTRKTVGRFKKL